MKKVLIPLLLLSALFWSAFAFIVISVPPEINSVLVINNLIYFFLTGFLAVALSLTSVLYSLQTLLNLPKLAVEDKDRVLKKRLHSSLRRGFLFSTLFLSLGILQITKTNNYLNTALVIIIVVLLETYWSNR